MTRADRSMGRVGSVQRREEAGLAPGREHPWQRDRTDQAHGLCRDVGDQGRQDLDDGQREDAVDRGPTPIL
jgi:hypothetical protein